MWRPATSPLFPYTTLFRSHPHRRIEMRGWRDLRHDIQAEMHREAGVRRQDRGGARAEGGRQIVRLQEFREGAPEIGVGDRKSTRLNSSHGYISYAVFCLKK